MESLNKFLTTKITNHDNNYNYQSKYLHDKYLIEDDMIDEFLQLYNNACKEGYPYIQERVRPNGYISVRCDIDIKRDITENLPHFYKTDEVERIIEIYQNQIRKHIKNVTPEQLICYLLEKDIKITDDKQKKGFHLEFPYLFLNKHEIKQILLPNIKKEYDESNMFSRYNDPTIFDEQAVVSNAWLLYGSVKEFGSLPYKITAKYNEEGKIEIGDINPKMFLINVSSDTKQYMRECYPNTSISKSKVTQLNEEKRDYNIPETASDFLQECKEVSPLLSSFAMTDYNSWRIIGQAIHDLTAGTRDGLELFISLSSRAKNYSECGCISFWKKLSFKGYHLGNLRFYAKRDFPEDYNLLYKSKSKHILLKEIEKLGGQLTIKASAYYLNILLRDDFLFCPEDNCFYQYKNHRWNCIDKEGHELRTKINLIELPITNEINKIREKQSKLEVERKDKEDNNDDPSSEIKEIKKYDKQRNLLVKERIKLYDSSFLDKIIKECRTLFLDRNFGLVKDTNKMLMGFTNGVLDMEEKKFRDGKPTDYITMTTGYDYIERDTSIVDKYFNQVFVKDELKYFVLNHLASCLEGENKHKKAIFWTGTGDNSKSILEKIVKKSFGEYSGLLSVSYFIGKIQGATPEINNVKHCRVVFTNEPTDKDEFDVGLLKEITGNDGIQTRKLHKESDKNTSSVMFKLVIPCNKVPIINSDDIATWNRIRVIPFESNFKENPDEKSEYEFKKDVDFDVNIEFLQAFMTKLFNVYKMGYDSYEPEPVLQETCKFKAKNDTIQHFINKKLVRDDSSALTISDMWDSFHTFYKDEYKDKKFNMVKEEFTSYIKKHFTLQINTIRGYRYIDTEEEDKKVEVKQTIDNDKENWKKILLGYKVSKNNIKHNAFMEKHNIHKTLIKKFCKWFVDESGFTLVECGKNPKNLLIEAI